MRWEVKVISDNTKLYTGPGVAFRTTGYVHKDDIGIIIDSKTNGGLTWYKWEDTGYWSCEKYIKKVKDLEVQKMSRSISTPTKNTTTSSKTIPSTTTTTYTDNTLNGIISDSSWYQPMVFTKYSYNVESDTVIAKDIAGLKHNMDIGYTTSDDIYANSNISDSTLGYSTGSNGYYTSLQKKLYNSFNRNKVAFPDRDLNKTFAYVFFTRPDLNILNTGASASSLVLNEQTNFDLKYKYIYNNNPWSLKSLVSAGNSYHKFMTLLSNEALSFEVGDVVIKTVEHGETYNGNKIIYGFSDQESNAAGEMSIRYIDTVNLDIYKLHLIWLDYINKVSRGIYTPKNTYIKEKIIDYAVSCYYFLCGPDGNTILYWQKLTGVFPVNTGENVFSWDSGTLLAQPEINIKYMYAFKSSMDMHILGEFNDLTDTSENVKAVYAKDQCMTGSTLTHAPRIFSALDVSGNQIFRLLWVEN